MYVCVCVCVCVCMCVCVRVWNGELITWKPKSASRESVDLQGLDNAEALCILPE